MKIYNSVTIDMTTLETIQEDSFEYNGPIAECKGGGNAGTVGFAGYIETFHTDMLGSFAGTDTDVGGAITAMQAANPYTSVNSYNPNIFIASTQERWEYLDTLVKAIDEHTTWDTMRTNVIDNINQTISDTYIEDLVDQYAKSIESDHASAVNRFAGPMSEINAVNSSAFILGMSNIEKDRLRKISAFRAEMIGKFEDFKQKMYDKGVTDMMHLLELKLKLDNAVTSLLADSNRIGAVLKKEQYADDLELDKMDVEWDMNVLRQAGGILAAPGGGQYIPEKPSKVASAASGALSGAATGAAIGSVVPGIGTAVGAGVGAVLGAVGGLG